jgi:hypothetical protein
MEEIMSSVQRYYSKIIHIIHTQPLEETISSRQSYNYLYHPHTATGRNHFIYTELLELIICMIHTQPLCAAEAVFCYTAENSHHLED